MTSKLKLVPLIVVAVLAVSGTGAATALAEVEITADEYPATLEGTSTEGEWTFEGKLMKCESESHKSTLESGSKLETRTQNVYSGCTTGGFPATVDMDGCDWVYNPGANRSTSKCPEGKKVKIYWYSTAQKHAEDIPTCTVSIEEQEVTAGEYTNIEGEGSKYIEYHEELSGIEYTVEGPALLCGTGGTATYTADITVTATSEAEEAIGVMIE